MLCFLCMHWKVPWKTMKYFTKIIKKIVSNRYRKCRYYVCDRIAYWDLDLHLDLVFFLPFSIAVASVLGFWFKDIIGPKRHFFIFSLLSFIFKRLVFWENYARGYWDQSNVFWGARRRIEEREMYIGRPYFSFPYSFSRGNTDKLPWCNVRSCKLQPMGWNLFL